MALIVPQDSRTGVLPTTVPNAQGHCSRAITKPCIGSPPLPISEQRSLQEEWLLKCYFLLCLVQAEIQVWDTVKLAARRLIAITFLHFCLHKSSCPKWRCSMGSNLTLLSISGWGDFCQFPLPFQPNSPPPSPCKGYMWVQSSAESGTVVILTHSHHCFELTCSFRLDKPQFLNLRPLFALRGWIGQKWEETFWFNLYSPFQMHWTLQLFICWPQRKMLVLSTGEYHHTKSPGQRHSYWILTLDS